MGSSDIKPGWYQLALPDLGDKVKVHAVHEGRVYFTRLGMAAMSNRSVESFKGIVKFPTIRLMIT